MTNEQIVKRIREIAAEMLTDALRIEKLGDDEAVSMYADSDLADRQRDIEALRDEVS